MIWCLLMRNILTHWDKYKNTKMAWGLINQYSTSMRPYKWVKARSAPLIEMKAIGQLLVSVSSPDTVWI
jgi:hypothetical protein